MSTKRLHCSATAAIACSRGQAGHAAVPDGRGTAALMEEGIARRRPDADGFGADRPRAPPFTPPIGTDKGSAG